MQKLVLIADIIASRKIEPRNKLQDQLNQAFAELNKSPTLLSPYTLTLGDEFQAVYGSARNLFQHVVYLQYIIYPVKARVGLGIGDIVTAINPKQSIGMDGLAFYTARDALEQLKKKGQHYSIRGAKLDHGLDLSQHMTASLSLVAQLQKKWKINRWHILWRLLQEQSIVEIAKCLAISESAVYKNISDGALDKVINTYRQIEIQLNQILMAES